MAKRRRQLSLLGENQEQPETAALFDSSEFPYDTPDEVAYNARRKKDGLFEITPAEEAAWKQALSDGSVQEE